MFSFHFSTLLTDLGLGVGLLGRSQIRHFHREMDSVKDSVNDLVNGESYVTIVKGQWRLFALHG